jgi:mono/diheme cytochrome c family protein
MKTFLHNIYKPLFLIVLGTAFTLMGFSPSLVFASPDVSGHDTYSKSEKNQSFLLTQHRGSSDCRAQRHNRGEHCSEMGHEGGCQGGMGGCRGGKGRGHRGGMGRGMHHGGGQSGPAQCPQPRATVKAPEEFYNLTNPLGNTHENIEKGRLLFTLDAQPTCVMCHGSQGDGTGGFGSNLSPPPRNFTCSETMKDISDGQLFWIIRNGSPDTGMPPFQDLKDDQIWSLIRFIRTLAR